MVRWILVNIKELASELKISEWPTSTERGKLDKKHIIKIRTAVAIVSYAKTNYLRSLFEYSSSGTKLTANVLRIASVLPACQRKIAYIGMKSYRGKSPKW